MNGGLLDRAGFPEASAQCDWPAAPIIKALEFRPRFRMDEFRHRR